MGVTVYVGGGTVTVIRVDNKTTGVTGGAVRLPVGSAIKIFYVEN